MKDTTKTLHTPYPKKDAYGALAVPVYHCAAYEFDNADVMADSFCGRSADPDYSRVTNPTVIHFENIIKNLTGARDVVAFNSGMAAITATLFGLAKAGNNIVTSRHLFGNTFLLMTKTMARFGVEIRLIDLTDLESVKQTVDKNTACIYLETVTNPQMEIADLKELAEIAHSVGAALVADTTMIPFTYFSARDPGVDVEVLSSTKYISGGATSLGGLVIDYGTLPGFDTILRKEMLMNFGAYLNPHAAYMQTLGLETLDARYSRQEANTMAVAEALAGRSDISLCYPGLASNPFHDICARQFGNRFGAMITMELPTEAACKAFINSLQLVKRATNLFDNRTLAIHPYSTIFGTLSEAEREAMDVSPRLIRLSIGLEDPADVIADLNQAIDKAVAAQ